MVTIGGISRDLARALDAPVAPLGQRGALRGWATTGAWLPELRGWGNQRHFWEAGACHSYTMHHHTWLDRGGLWLE